MDGNNFIRASRLLRYLLTNPTSINRYLKYSIFCSNKPIDLGVPWIASEAIDFLKKWGIGVNSQILELGGGGSTIFFGQLGADLTCFESNILYSKELINKISELELFNVKVNFMSYNNILDIESFKETDYYKYIIYSNKKYDIILIDNYEEIAGIRQTCFYAAERNIKVGGIIILDDSYRYPKIRENNSAKNYITFKSIGPCRIGITTTDIFFY
ncbi:hypothetical protein EZS27_013258 [termite gut metagenome]|uniref:Class I SAM-dependent methyltransferase n=1 Tax=termite gut metagenome TaxID=433724 RepID=A0A5J4RYA2_9ZZZZ